MFSRIRLNARLLIACMPLVLVLAFASSFGVSAAATAPRVGGWFLFGTNMPWLNWNADFGGGPNGGGVSSNVSQLDSKLQTAHNAGMHIIRWWVFEGGSPQIQRDANGTPTGLNPTVYTDMDAALAEAAKFDMSYNFVLFDGTTDDAVTHQWWEDSTKRAALVRVLTPLFQHYASNARVHTWELVNEPEWQSRNGTTTVAGMLATGDALTNAIHQNSHALVTVGNAQVQDMATWAGHPLDYYSPHYYDNFGTGSNDPFLNNANSPDGKPIVIGEFPADTTSTNPDARTRWNSLYANGYAGGWNWSLSPEHTGDHIGTDLTAATAFSTGKTDLGPRISSTPPTPLPTATATPASTTVRVNAGGPAYTGGDGRAWSADKSFSGGQTATLANAISGTSDQTLYQSERYGNFSYSFSVPNGTYSVVLKFAEIYWSSAGQRVFNVAINGQQVLSNFDILANVPKNTALDKAFTTNVTNGTLNVTFTTIKDNAKVSAIEIVPSTGVRVNGGGPAYTGGDGRAWQADTGFSGGQTATVASAISGTSDQTLYQSERYGNFSYSFSRPNGTYTVTLKFAEIYWSSAGQRVFNVAINGQQVLSNFDILASVPKNTALDKTFTASVTNGTLTITFTTIRDNAKISAIEVVSS